MGEGGKPGTRRRSSLAQPPTSAADIVHDLEVALDKEDKKVLLTMDEGAAKAHYGEGRRQSILVLTNPDYFAASPVCVPTTSRTSQGASRSSSEGFPSLNLDGIPRPATNMTSVPSR